MTKIIEAAPDASVLLELDEAGSATLSSGRASLRVGNAVAVDGSITTTASEASLKTGMVFGGVPELLGVIPSTVVTPTPAKVPAPPVVQSMRGIGALLRFYV